MVSLNVAFVVTSLLLASIVGQVYSIACYKCHEQSDGNDCRNNTQKIKFLRHCGGGSSQPAGIPNFAYIAPDDSFKCLTAEIKNSSASVIERGCVPSFVTCELIKTLERYNDNSTLVNGQLESCTLCDGDKCNSSSKIGMATFNILIVSLVSYFIFN